jgi:hypothetical protein
MPLGERIMDDMRSVHDKFHEFSMYRKGDINLSLIFFSEICTMITGIIEIWIGDNDVLDQGIPTKFVSKF